MTDKQRTAFEAWLKTKPEALYWNTSDAMLTAWTASRKLALEEAAQIVDRQSAIYNFKMDQAATLGREERRERFYNYGEAADFIAESIRAAAIRQQQEEGK